jgi:hypothetical protein
MTDTQLIRDILSHMTVNEAGDLAERYAEGLVNRFEDEQAFNEYEHVFADALHALHRFTTD